MNNVFMTRNVIDHLFATGAKGGTDVDVYARWLVSQTANKRAPGWIYKSQYSTRAWLMVCSISRMACRYRHPSIFSPD